MLFTGRSWEAASGLYYYRTRWYDPKAGRFTSRDSIGLWGDPANLGNGYAYVGNNPWTWVDAWGLFTIYYYKYDERKEKWVEVKSPPCEVANPRENRLLTAIKKIQRLCDSPKLSRIGEYYRDFGFSADQVRDWFQDGKGPVLNVYVGGPKNGYGQYGWGKITIKPQAVSENLIELSIVHELAHYARDKGTATPELRDYCTEDRLKYYDKHRILEGAMPGVFGGGEWGYPAEDVYKNSPDHIKRKPVN